MSIGNKADLYHDWSVPPRAWRLCAACDWIELDDPPPKTCPYCRRPMELLCSRYQNMAERETGA